MGYIASIRLYALLLRMHTKSSAALWVGLTRLQWMRKHKPYPCLCVVVPFRRLLHMFGMVLEAPAGVSHSRRIDHMEVTCSL